MPDDERNRFGRSFGEGYSYVALGFSFAFAILAFGALGWVVDGWLGTRPLFALVGAGLGGFGGVLAGYYPRQPDGREGDGGSGQRQARGRAFGWGCRAARGGGRGAGAARGGGRGGGGG